MKDTADPAAAVAFDEEEPSGLDFKEIFTKLESDTTRRSGTWQSMTDEGDGRNPKMRQTETAQLIVLTSRMFLNAFARKIERTVADDGDHIAIGLVMAGQSDEATFRLRVSKQPSAAAVSEQQLQPADAQGLKRDTAATKKRKVAVLDKVVYTEISFSILTRSAQYSYPFFQIGMFLPGALMSDVVLDSRMWKMKATCLLPRT